MYKVQFFIFNLTTGDQLTKIQYMMLQLLLIIHFFVARTVNSEYMRRTENREGLVANLHYNRTKRLFIQCVGIQVTLSDYYSLSSPPTL